MAKIKINTSLETDEDNVNKNLLGIYNNDKITYKEDKINVTISIAGNTIKLSRIADDYYIEMEFIKNKKTKGIYNIISHNIQMDMKVKTNILEIFNNRILIVYELELNNENMGIYKFEVKYEVIE